MYSSEPKVTTCVEPLTTPMAKINGRHALQPSTCNRVPIFDRLNSLKKTTTPTPPVRPPPIKRANVDANSNPNAEKASVNRGNSVRALERKKSKSFKEGLIAETSGLRYASSMITESPGSIAAVRREQVAHEQAQRKMRIAHYGRSKSAKFDSKVVPLDPLSDHKTSEDHEKRCSFITPNSDPIYVSYHDEEWGVPVHDDKMLFELLVLSGAQVGSDWTSILRKREDFRNAFLEFNAQEVAKLSDKQINAMSTEYKIDVSRVRGVVENANKILEVEREFGSFNKYIWGFVNHKPISTNYRFGHRIPVKTSKSESISKDMVRRGFRYVGPTVVHSFMQAAGLTNDHLITCRRHLPCTLIPTHISKSIS